MEAIHENEVHMAAKEKEIDNVDHTEPKCATLEIEDVPTSRLQMIHCIDKVHYGNHKCTHISALHRPAYVLGARAMDLNQKVKHFYYDREGCSN